MKNKHSIMLMLITALMLLSLAHTFFYFNINPYRSFDAFLDFLVYSVFYGYVYKTKKYEQILEERGINKD